MTTTTSAAARRVTYQLETLWDYDYVPTHEELAVLYETAKKNQWNASTAIDWTRAVGTEGPVLNVQMAFVGTNFFPKLTPEEQKEVEIRVSAWRLSQFLHGEQGALVVCGQLVNSIPELDAKLYASTQVVDEGRHVEVFERYVKKLHQIYPVDPLLKALLDEILSTNLWELKLLGMQMIIEGLAIAPSTSCGSRRATRRWPSSSTTSFRTKGATSTSVTSRCGARSPPWSRPSENIWRTSRSAPAIKCTRATSARAFSP
jgi:hypothetical protein